MSPATDGGYQTFGVRLTVAPDRVYGWYRPRIPGYFERVLLDCGVEVIS